MRSLVLALLAAGCGDYRAATPCEGGESIFDDTLGVGWTFSSTLTAELDSQSLVANGNYALEAKLDVPWGLLIFRRRGFDTAALGNVCLWIDNATAPLNLGPAYAGGTTSCAAPCSDVGDGTCWCWRTLAPFCAIAAGTWWRCELPLGELLQPGYGVIDAVGIQFGRGSVDAIPPVIHLDNLTLTGP